MKSALTCGIKRTDLISSVAIATDFIQRNSVGFHRGFPSGSPANREQRFVGNRRRDFIKYPPSENFTFSFSRFCGIILFFANIYQFSTRFSYSGAIISPKERKPPREGCNYEDERMRGYEKTSVGYDIRFYPHGFYALQCA